MVGVAHLLDVLQSVRLYARRLADDHPADRNMTRAADALDEQIDTLVEEVVPESYLTHHSLRFRVKPPRETHGMTLTTMPPHCVAIVDDSSGVATLALVAPAYPHIVVALRQWADRVEAQYTE